MARVTEAHIDARTESILAAAERAFARKGYFGATMQDIATEAGLSAGAIYHYFAGKEAIIEAIGDARSEDSRDIIAGVAREAGSSLDAFAMLARAFFTQLQPRHGDRGCIDFELWSAALRNDHVRDTIVRGAEAVIAPLTELLRQAQANGDLADDIDAEALARVLYGTFDGLTVQLATGQPADVDRYVDALVAMFSGQMWSSRKVARRVAAPQRKAE
jgi:AcrR family transcriptional regulator